MHMSPMIISCVILIAVVQSNAQRAAPQQSPEQVSFSAEDGQVKRPVPLPVTVKAMLSNDEIVKQTLEYEHITSDKLPAEWFLASEVRLAGASERDLVVIATGHLAGANVTTFWIFRPNGDRFIPILNAAPAHDLKILGTRSNGYRDLTG
jgi:hypothetical protein